MPHLVGARARLQDIGDGPVIVHMVVLVFPSNDLQCRTELAAIFLLGGHLDVG